MMFDVWLQHLFTIFFSNGVPSSMFSIKSGSMQGGVYSGWLFNLYANELILKLQDCGFICRLHGIFVSCILYANILLVSGSLIKLQLILKLF